MRKKLVDLADAMARIPSGATVCLGGSLFRRAPTAAVHELIRRGVRDLTVQTWAATIALDLLCAAKAVRRYEGIYAGMFGHGLAPNFRRAAESGAMEIGDFSETAMVARFRAAAQGLPSLPVTSLFGSDIALQNPEQIREYACPITGKRLLAVAAATADFTVIHGYVGDEFGNVQWPIVRDSDDVDQMMAAASTRLIVTVEQIVPHEELRQRPALTYIPGHLVEVIAEVPFGSHPAAVDGFYDEDEPHLHDYLNRSASAEGAIAYLDEFVHATGKHAAYVERCGGLTSLRTLEVANARAERSDCSVGGRDRG